MEGARVMTRGFEDLVVKLDDMVVMEVPVRCWSDGDVVPTPVPIIWLPFTNRNSDEAKTSEHGGFRWLVVLLDHWGLSDGCGIFRGRRLRMKICIVVRIVRAKEVSETSNHRRHRWRASLNNVPLSAEGGGLRPGRIIESDKLSADVRKRAMDAVDKSGRRVTVGDVASKAGIKLTEAQRALQAIAADTNGFLEVSDEGDVLYVFPKDYRSKLAAKSLRIKTEPYLEKAKSAGEYLIRVTFGTALIASIVIVYTTIIAILTSSSEEDNRGRRRGRSFDSGFSFYLSPSDLFWYWDPYYYRRRRVRKEGNGMNFIESVFSFVFGDGDPNEGIEEERWKLIGQYIASNGGVVTAEELAPYLDVESAEKTDDDSYILPVLLRFDGQPQVDEEGNILYRFPSLQRTASQTSGRKEYVGRRFSEWVGEVDKFFKENKWDFSKISSTERAMVGGLGALNLFGVIVLGTMNMTVSPSGFVSFVSEIFPLLQILSARDMSQRTVIRQDQIVYTTERDIFEQDYDTQEWDRRFKEIDKNSTSSTATSYHLMRLLWLTPFLNRLSILKVVEVLQKSFEEIKEARTRDKELFEEAKEDNRKQYEEKFKSHALTMNKEMVKKTNAKIAEMFARIKSEGQRDK
ncbi:hypothetical protein Tco_1016636 [Tanacetum coccineum]|uniref:Iron-sulfur cluster biosynthesis family protein n=1 Tax=Tanacetum coccineum TaxID=301880 RepID=A0ABQ5FP65_9ASTR